MRRFLLIASTLVLSALTVSCGENSTGPTTASIAGTYSLRTINGTPLPYLLSPANPKLEFMSSVVTVNSNGTWTSTSTIRATSGTTVTTQAESSSGTYTLTGTAAVFTDSSDLSTTTATVSGESLIVADAGLSLVYTK